MSSLPPSVHDAIKRRFDSLGKEGGALLTRMEQESLEEGELLAIVVSPLDFEAYRTSVLNLIAHLGPTQHMDHFTQEIRAMKSYASHMARLLGMVRALADDFASGFLDSLIHRVEAEVAADYLGQAERLLVEGGSGKYDHVPAAVLFGAVLEKALRTLCGRQKPALPLENAKGDPKMLNGLIDDLKKAGAFNELKAKQLRAWADVRNAAAHGDFDKFARSDVEAMSTGIQSFLADYL